MNKDRVFDVTLTHSEDLTVRGFTKLITNSLADESTNPSVSFSHSDQSRSSLSTCTINIEFKDEDIPIFTDKKNMNRIIENILQKAVKKRKKYYDIIVKISGQVLEFASDKSNTDTNNDEAPKTGSFANGAIDRLINWIVTNTNKKFQLIGMTLMKGVATAFYSTEFQLCTKDGVTDVKDGEDQRTFVIFFERLVDYLTSTTEIENLTGKNKERLKKALFSLVALIDS
jgi:hypothetical protein